MQKTTDCQRSDQIGLFLPERPTDDILRDRLADLVERLNDPLATPEDRIVWHGEVTKLRRILGMECGR
jgi:hypothetical protein